MPAGDVPPGYNPAVPYREGGNAYAPPAEQPYPLYGSWYPNVDCSVISLELNGSSGNVALEAEVAVRMQRAFNLWKERQRKYGVTNIARTGALGCYVRCEDKLARLSRVYVEGAGEMPDETIKDSWLDVVNYAIMGLMNHEGAWPKV